MDRLVPIAAVVVFAALFYVAFRADQGRLRLDRLGSGVTPRGALPLPVMTPEFEQRYRERLPRAHRATLIVLIVMVIALAAAICFTDVISLAPLFCAFFLLLFATRACTNLYDRRRQEAEHRGSADFGAARPARRLTDFFPTPQIYFAMTLSVVTAPLTIYCALALHDGATPFTSVALIASVATIPLGWIIAAVIARQPVPAESEADIRWEESLIREDVQLLPFIGTLAPAIALMLITPNIRLSTIGWIPAIALIAIGIAFGILSVVAERNAARRLWPDPLGEQ
ncbi:MAG: hypothetical protein PUK40_01555 [Actinomycetaceae bacterium]|nr:hypothetical protein [Arcanobacterium sp.]MDD7504629.1 hypothetical protein [Actinomycetaceae bacterium]MDY6143055.1 hypothetical protein [Arcanobacterium sp.]